MQVLGAQRAFHASLRLRFATLLAIALMSCADLGYSAATAAEAQSLEHLLDQCAKRIRDGGGEWVECQASFGTDQEGRRVLEGRTAGLVQGALCSGPIRVQRKVLIDALKHDGDLRVGEHDLECELMTGMAQRYAVTLTLAPIVTFRGGSVADIRVGLKAVAPLSELLTVPLAELLDTDAVREQLARYLDALLQRAFPEGLR